MKRIYYMVPPCPACGSRKTGRYMKRPFRHEEYTMVESLKNGEIIKFKDHIPQKNAFCTECGHTWPESVHAALITPDEMEEEIHARKTEKLLEQYKTANGLTGKKKRFLGGFFSGLLDL